MIFGIHDHDLHHLINYMMTAVAKQGYALGLVFTLNNSTLVKFRKKIRKRAGDHDFKKKHAGDILDLLKKKRKKKRSQF